MAETLLGRRVSVEIDLFVSRADALHRNTSRAALGRAQAACALVVTSGHPPSISERALARVDPRRASSASRSATRSTAFAKLARAQGLTIARARALA